MEFEIPPAASLTGPAGRANVPSGSIAAQSLRSFAFAASRPACSAERRAAPCASGALLAQCPRRPPAPSLARPGRLYPEPPQCWRAQRGSRRKHLSALRLVELPRAPPIARRSVDRRPSRRDFRDRAGGSRWRARAPVATRPDHPSIGRSSASIRERFAHARSRLLRRLGRLEVDLRLTGIREGISQPARGDILPALLRERLEE